MLGDKSLIIWNINKLTFNVNSTHQPGLIMISHDQYHLMQLEIGLIVMCADSRLCHNKGADGRGEKEVIIDLRKILFFLRG